MTKYLPKLAINILTFKTDRKILKNCIDSIDKSIPINIIENSNDFKDKLFFKKIRKNIKFFCTGKNYGYGKGHNYGLSKINSRYVLICNPDVVFKKYYFKNIFKILNNNLEFNIIGSQYSKNHMNRPAYGLFDEKKINPIIKKNKLRLQKVNWVVGCTMLFDLSKFSTKKIFDENFFLFYEETDLCKRVISKKGLIYSGSNLIIKHLGEKSSFAIIPKFKIDYIKLRNWHLMWSSFYFERKHYGYIYSLISHFPSFIKDLLKVSVYLIFLRREKFIKHFYRFLGLYNSMIGNKSKFRLK
jgi:N-acetylglucosaminyl-diphospho-decaprenol L-rhamnosyltransferase